MNKAGVVAMGLAAGICCSTGSGAAPGQLAARTNLLDAAALAAGFEATKVVLDADGAKVRLDPYVFKFGTERAGVITTDPMDVGPSGGLIAQAAGIRRVMVALDADVPERAAVLVEARTGGDFFDQSAWTPWQHIEKAGGNMAGPLSRYVQVRVTLSSTVESALPGASRLAVTSEFDGPAPVEGIRVVKADIPVIVRSPVSFQYERPDQAKIVRFRKRAKLDDVVTGAKDDFEKLVRLMDWVGSCSNDRTKRSESSGGYYAWDIDKVFDVVAVEKDGRKVETPTIYGHCMSYSEVLVTAATAMGFKARHMAMVGFREASHEVVDAWVPSLGRWVYLDPSLSNYYYDRQTSNTLNLIQMHDVVAASFVPEGKDMHWFSVRGSDETKSIVRKVGGKFVIGSRLGPWKYGEPMPADYDWGWYHGYLAAGFVQMTPRNDYNGHPEAICKHFGSLPGYAGFPFWVDAKTPPVKGVSKWYRRKRDFYWTLDQASIRLVAEAGKPDVLNVELGQSMPFFASYRLEMNGKTSIVKSNACQWKLRKGANSLAVSPVDEFGSVGRAASVELEYVP